MKSDWDFLSLFFYRSVTIRSNAPLLCLKEFVSPYTQAFREFNGLKWSSCGPYFECSCSIIINNRVSSPYRYEASRAHST